MNVANLTVRGFWRLWALAAVLLGLVVLNWQPTLEPATAPRAAAPLQLPPPLKPRDPSDDLVQLDIATLWGPRATAPADSTAPTMEAEPAWFLSGTYAAHGDRALVVHFEGQAKPSLQLRAGDRLPDGSRLIAIEPDRVQVRQAGGRGTPVWLAINPGMPMNDNRQTPTPAR